MPLYELYFALRPKIGEDGKETIKNKIEGFIGQNGGRLESIDDLGLRKLTYEVEGEKEGIFLRALVNIDSTFTNRLTQWMRAQDEVIRLMLIRAEHSKKTSVKNKEEKEIKNVSQ